MKYVGVHSGIFFRDNTDIIMKQNYLEIIEILIKVYSIQGRFQLSGGHNMLRIVLCHFLNF